jgi:hypothetical protein
MNQPKVPTLDELVKAIKDDVLQAMRDGDIPTDVRSFSALHDHCDANCLGGLCETATFDAIWKQFSTPGSTDGMPQGMLDLINGAQNAVNEWLTSGQAQVELAGNPAA